MKTATQNLVLQLGLLLSLSSWSLPSWAAPSLDEVLKQTNRPSIYEVAKIAQLIPDKKYEATTKVVEATLSANGHQLDFTGWFKVLEAGTPNLIAALEFAHPNATFAFMGRDTQALADGFEAFYASLGQSDRVVRLGMSKATFVNTSPNVLIDFLKGKGFSLDRLSESHPFILVDTVSQGDGRQGRALIDAVYTEYARRGGNPADLVRKFNMVGLVVRTFKGRMNLIENAPRDLAIQEKHYRDNPARPANGFGADHALLYFVDKAKTAINEAGYTHFTGAWHESYNQMTESKTGFPEAVPGQATRFEMRQAILLFQKRILNSFSSATFAEQVMSSAKNWKIAINNVRPQIVSPGNVARLQPELPSTPAELNSILLYNESIADFANVDFKQQFAQLNQNLQVARSEEDSVGNAGYLQQNFEGYSQRYSVPAVGVGYIHGLGLAIQQKKIYVKSAPSYLRQCIELTPITPQLVDEFKELLAKAPSLISFFKDPQASGWMNGSLGGRNFKTLSYALSFDIDSLVTLAEEREKAKEAAKAAAEAEKIAKATQDATEYRASMTSKLKKFVASLKPEGGQDTKHYLTQNATDLSDWLDKELKFRAKLEKIVPNEMKTEKNELTLYFISEVTRTRDANLISSKDYRRVLARALSYSDLNANFFEYFGKLYHKEATLKKCLQKKAEFFRTTERQGTENTKAVYDAIRTQVMTDFVEEVVCEKVWEKVPPFDFDDNF